MIDIMVRVTEKYVLQVSCRCYFFFFFNLSLFKAALDLVRIVMLSPDYLVPFCFIISVQCIKRILSLIYNGQILCQCP